MGTKKSKSAKPKRNNRYHFTIRQRRFQVIADKVLFFKLLQNLHGRFWGIAAVWGMILGMTICFLIQPDKLLLSTAFSDFGNDVRTAPYFSGTMFFAAYGLWRWRNYLTLNLKRSGVVLILVTCTIIGLYLVALMPVSWQPWPYRIHFFGVVLAGSSMAATVVADGVLTKTAHSKHENWNRIVRMLAVLIILIGGFLTFMSSTAIAKLHVALLGETLILAGYSIWVYVKTIQGEGSRSRLSKLLQKVIVIK